jgi:hypothetical protein
MKFIAPAVPAVRARLAALVPFALVAVACSSNSAAPPASFPLSFTSDSGALRVEVTATAGQPTVGTNTLEMTVANAADGSPRDDVSIAVVPWMPSMGHGTAPPSVTSEGQGKYLLTDVYLFMPGTWELAITFSGSVSDHADPAFQIQ